jgi:hypothetical protein
VPEERNASDGAEGGDPMGVKEQTYASSQLLDARVGCAMANLDRRIDSVALTTGWVAAAIFGLWGLALCADRDPIVWVLGRCGRTVL